MADRRRAHAQTQTDSRLPREGSTWPDNNAERREGGESNMSEQAGAGSIGQGIPQNGSDPTAKLRVLLAEEPVVVLHRQELPR